MSILWGKARVFLKRMARYLVHAPEFAIEHGFEQSAEEGIVVYTDIDWGSCRTTGRSTSGGVICVGGQDMACDAS